MPGGEGKTHHIKNSIARDFFCGGKTEDQKHQEDDEEDDEEKFRDGE
jgi:hypothetical protein